MIKKDNFQVLLELLGFKKRDDVYSKKFYELETELKVDKALFNHTTAQMKAKLGVKESKPLADFMPTILLKAKDFATEITIYNAKENEMTQENEISSEHITNNKAVRETLLSRGIVPENVKPAEDVKKVERRLKSDLKKLEKNGTKK